MAGDLKAHWVSQAWHLEAETWILAMLRANGIQPTGAIEQPRIRFWSTQLTVPTEQGRFWFKENNPNQAFEASLVAALADIIPEHVVVPLAVEQHHGWMLSPDHGPTMYAVDESRRDVWVAMVRGFAEVQRCLIEHRDRLLETGLIRLAPTEVPSFVEECLVRSLARPRTDPRHVDADLASRVRDALPWLEAHAEMLESGPVPLSLEHNDLHDNNTFVPQAERSLRFFDFGDALWAHPFTSMCVPVEHMSDAWQMAADAPDIAYVVDAYLEVWSDLGTVTELRSLMRSALPFGQAHRLMSWERVLPYADGEDLTAFGGAIPGWLDRLVTEVARAAS